MAKLLYLVHRLPYPPNKGDKVRSYHLLKHLASQHEVHLGTFVDDPEDEVHIETVRGLCKSLHVSRLTPHWAKLRSLSGLLRGQALSVAYYRDGAMRQWATRQHAVHGFDAVVVFSSVMAQYAQDLTPQVPMLVDFVDVDSAKWAQYAGEHRWPMSWVYRREGDQLLAYEQQVANQAQASFFVTDKEVALFKRLAPACRAQVDAVCNGVDAEFFSPQPQFPSPFAPQHLPLVFTGAMDYWPNVDAVTWFTQEVLPQLQKDEPRLHFYVVGRSPTPAVQALAGPNVTVTGTVADVRPYLQHAALVVAPLRLARGIQNKVLEAMAMGKAVVAASTCVQAIDAVEGRDLIAAESVEDYVRQIQSLLTGGDRAGRIGAAGRECVLQRYSWSAHLGGVDQHLTRVLTMKAAA